MTKCHVPSHFRIFAYQTETPTFMTDRVSPLSSDSPTRNNALRVSPQSDNIVGET